jgi:AMP nucleosidase
MDDLSSDLSEQELQHQERIARDTIERYSGSDYREFQPFVLLTNFPQYVHYFADTRQVAIHEGSMFKVAHCPEEEVSILDF